MPVAATHRREDTRTLFATPEITADRRADGTIWLQSTAPLQPHTRCVGDWLEHWARETPERIFLGERASVETRWSTVTLPGCAAAGARDRSLDSGAWHERRTPAGDPPTTASITRCSRWRRCRPECLLRRAPIDGMPARV